MQFIKPPLEQVGEAVLGMWQRDEELRRLCGNNLIVFIQHLGRSIVNFAREPAELLLPGLVDGGLNLAHRDIDGAGQGRG